MINGIEYGSNPLTIIIDGTSEISAHFIEESNMGNQNLLGEIRVGNSPAANQGEIVTLSITKDGVTSTYTTSVDSAANFAYEFTGLPGTYSAVASVPASSEYSSATSDPFIFTLSLTQRTITIHG